MFRETRIHDEDKISCNKQTPFEMYEMRTPLCRETRNRDWYGKGPNDSGTKYTNKCYHWIETILHEMDKI